MIKAWINYQLWKFAYSWHATICAARYRVGRLFVFRDRPDWFVKETAELLDVVRRRRHESLPIIQQAADEWQLRLRKRGASQ